MAPPNALLPATDRHNHGRAHLAHALNHWLSRGSLSNRQLARIADWGMEERGWLADTRVTDLRRNKFAKSLVTGYCDALGVANQAIWRWQTQGADAALAALGPPEAYRVKTEWLNGATWLAHPEYPAEPLGPADWFEIASGYLHLDYVASPVLAPREGPMITEEFCDLVMGLMPELSTRDRLRKILKAYPVSDVDRREKLASALQGISTYSSEEFQDELFSLSRIVIALRGLSSRDYGPVELYAELTEHRRQTGGSRDDDY